MEYETYLLDTGTKASLTRYQLQDSSEMPQARIRPAVLIMPGGGYAYLSEREAEPVAVAFLNMGYHAYILRYSVGMHGLWPKPLEEAEKAMEMIRSNAEKWHTDPARIAAVGFSAGGHLAAALAAAGAHRPNALILGYPGLNAGVLQTGFLHEELTWDGQTWEPYPVILDQVDKDTPPAFVFFAGKDPVIHYADMNRFFGKMAAYGIPFEMHHFAYGGHGFSIGTDAVSGGAMELYDPCYRGRWVEMCCEWLKKTWGSFEHEKPYAACRMQPDCTWTGPEYSLDDQAGVLLENPLCVRILKQVFPDIEELPDDKRGASITYLVRMTGYGNVSDFRELVELEDALRRVKKEKEI